MSAGMDSQCATCKFWGVVGGGDWVPYGSSGAHLPYEYGCHYEFSGDEDEELEEKALQFECPKYEELPRCPKHPDQYVTNDGGCAECEYEAWMGTSDTAFERRQ